MVAPIPVTAGTPGPRLPLIFPTFIHPAPFASATVLLELTSNEIWISGYAG